jgi:hypothetical protein
VIAIASALGPNGRDGHRVLTLGSGLIHDLDQVGDLFFVEHGTQRKRDDFAADGFGQR